MTLTASISDYTISDKNRTLAAYVKHLNALAQARMRAAAEAETLIQQEQLAFEAWRDSLETVPAIKVRAPRSYSMNTLTNYMEMYNAGEPLAYCICCLIGCHTAEQGCSNPLLCYWAAFQPRNVAGVEGQGGGDSCNGVRKGDEQNWGRPHQEAGTHPDLSAFPYVSSLSWCCCITLFLISIMMSECLDRSLECHHGYQS